MLGLILPWLAGCPNGTQTQVQAPVYFDMGTAQSPLVPNHVRAQGTDAYRPERGWGFEGALPQSFLLEDAGERRRDGRYTRMENFRLLADDQKRDGVRAKEMRFRVDLAPGTYFITVTLGDLLTSMGSVRLFANDRLIQKNIAFQHAANRTVSGSLKEPSNGRGCYGMYDRLRFEVEVPDGVLRLRLDGDQTDYDRRLAQETAGPRLRSWINGREMDHDIPPYRNIGEPFLDVPLLAVEVVPAMPLPLAMESHGQLVYHGSDAGVVAAVANFNAGEYDAAGKALATSRGSDALARGLGYLWLAGWLDNPEDPRLCELAQIELTKALARDPHNPWARAAQEDCALYGRALDLHLQRSSEGRDHFTENHKAHHFFGLIHTDSPLYWRARFHGARCALQLDPHRWVSSGQVGIEWFEDIKRAFPNNPHAIYFTTDNHDANSGPWSMPPRSDLYRKSDPEWAVRLHRTYSLILALSEWWVTHRQRPDGSFGGGMDDDVELVRLFGYYGLISEGSAPLLLEGAARLVERLYREGGSIEPESGYPWIVGDSEHTAELTGNTLPMMMVLDYGNPLWIERGMQIGKLFRDVWSAKTIAGHRHFRSNFTGALGVGGGGTANDSIINRRCLFPVERVLWYNRHPVLERLLVEWADAWLEDSLRTDKGKPRGLLPANIAFETEEMNGLGAESWHTGNQRDAKDTVNYNFGAYQAYHVGLMDLAYELSGEERFLEPARLGAEHYRKLEGIEADWNAPHGSPPKVKHGLLSAYQSWNRHQAAATEDDASDPHLANHYAELVKEYGPILDSLTRSWPVLTSEASATDRIHFTGMPRTFRHYTGGKASGDDEVALFATYEGVGRDFAASITEATDKRLEVSIYVFREGNLTVGLRPWGLELGATYQVTVAPDIDLGLDLAPDSDGTTWEFEASHRGQAIQLPLSGRQTQRVRIRQVRRGHPQTRLADLGLSKLDLEYDAEYSTMTVRVHNTGTAVAEDIDVLVYRGQQAEGEPLARMHLPRIEWPALLDAQTVKLGFRYRPLAPQETFTVVIDPEDKVVEITEHNNRVSKTLWFGRKPTQRSQPR